MILNKKRLSPNAKRLHTIPSSEDSPIAVLKARSYYKPVLDLFESTEKNFGSTPFTSDDFYNSNKRKDLSKLNLFLLNQTDRGLLIEENGAYRLELKPKKRQDNKFHIINLKTNKLVRCEELPFNLKEKLDPDKQDSTIQTQQSLPVTISASKEESEHNETLEQPNSQSTSSEIHTPDTTIFSQQDIHYQAPFPPRKRRTSETEINDFFMANSGTVPQGNSLSASSPSINLHAGSQIVPIDYSNAYTRPPQSIPNLAQPEIINCQNLTTDELYTFLQNF